jgi:hypothetical protein
MRRLAWRARRLHGRGEDGFATVFVLGLFMSLLMCTGLLLDGGLALSGRITALDEAQQAARAGAQALNLAVYRTTGTAQLDPQAAVQAAQAYLAGTGDTGSVQVQGATVTVTVTHVQHTALLDLVGLDTITVHATQAATAEQTDEN